MSYRRGCFDFAAHDLVTTSVTWNREISRIVVDRCAACHNDKGTAFSLMTYAEARPWAVAIKEEALSRRMPPWGAVKGFGEFRNGSVEPLLWLYEYKPAFKRFFVAKAANPPCRDDHPRCAPPGATVILLPA